VATSWPQASNAATSNIGDLIDGLEFAGQLILGARKNKWTFLLDTTYVKLNWAACGSSELQIQVIRWTHGLSPQEMGF